MDEYFANCHSLFTEDILAEPLPYKLKMPQHGGYEGEEDLLGYLNTCTSRMELQIASDDIMCRALT